MVLAALSMLETEEQKNELNEFYEANRKRLFGYAFQKIRNREAAEDAIQETFLNIMKYPNKFFELESHKKVSYVLTVLGNVISGMLKDSSKKSFNELDENIEDDALSVEDIVIGQISAGKLKEFIGELPETRRSIIILKAVHGLSYPQIADVLGISEEAVRKRISNAYKQINQFLDGEIDNE